MVAQMAPGLIPKDDSRPGLPGDLEVLGRVVERHFDGSINFLASHVELGHAASIIETAGKNWKACDSLEAVEALAEDILTPKPVEPAVLEPEIRFTPGLVIEKDGISHVVCPGKFGQCLRLVPVTEARVALMVGTFMRALGAKRLEDVTLKGLLQKSFCPKCAETVLPLGSQTVPEAMALVEKTIVDANAAEEAKKAEEESRKLAMQDNRSWLEVERDGMLIAHAYGLVRKSRRDQTGKPVAGVSSQEYRQLGLAANKIRKSGITAADVRTIKNWTVAGVIRMAELKLQAMLS